jgi:hypothetical protein
VLNIPMPEIILNEPGIASVVGKREAASVAQHVRMGREGEGGGFAIFLHISAWQNSRSRSATACAAR